MKFQLEYPLNVLVEAVFTTYGRLCGFVFFPVAGSFLGQWIASGSLPGWSETLTPFLWAPLGWLVSWQYLVLDLISLIVLITLVWTESTLAVCVCFAVLLFAWGGVAVTWF